MKKNFYFKEIVKRQNLLRDFVLSFFLSLSSYPRLLIEVFIRKDFGERYFRLSSAITVFVIVASLPLLSRFFTEDYSEEGETSFLTGSLTLYIYLCAFMFFSIKRHMETRRNPSVFDLEKYSLYNGTIHPFFNDLKIANKSVPTRLIETVLEPAPFFIAGVILSLLHQQLGGLLIFCSVFYSLSQVAQYERGDNYVMDMLDQMILNKGLEDAFVNDVSPEENMCIRPLGRKPADREMRRRLLSNMMEEEEVFVVT